MTYNKTEGEFGSKVCGEDSLWIFTKRMDWSFSRNGKKFWQLCRKMKAAYKKENTYHKYSRTHEQYLTVQTQLEGEGLSHLDLKTILQSFLSRADILRHSKCVAIHRRTVLKIRLDKWACLRDNFVSKAKIDNSSIERVKEFEYLGTMLTDQNSIQEEIKSRMKLGNVCYH
jgi:hypothetical protein